MDDEDQDEFWRRTSQRDNLEALRRYERERNSVGWRRNLTGLVLLALALCALWYLLRR